MILSLNYPWTSHYKVTAVDLIIHMVIVDVLLIQSTVSGLIKISGYWKDISKKSYKVSAKIVNSWPFLVILQTSVLYLSFKQSIKPISQQHVQVTQYFERIGAGRFYRHEIFLISESQFLCGGSSHDSGRQPDCLEMSSLPSHHWW